MKLRNIPTGSSSRIALFACACLLGLPSANAQRAEPLAEIVGEPWTGGRGVIRSVAEIDAQQALIDVQGRRVRAPRVRKIFEEFHPIKQQDPKSPKTSRWPMASTETSEAHTLIEPRAPQEVGANFAAVSFFDGGNAVPPDSMGSVGLTQVMVITNGRMRVFDKQGNLGALDVDLDTFFGGFLSPGQFASDPHVRYDRLTGRWFVTAITATGAMREPPNNIMIAVSSGPTINGSSSFSFFAFRHDQAGPQPNPDSNGFADYDTLGVDTSALYVGVNVFKFIGISTVTISSTGYVINKQDLLNGVLTITPLRQLGTFTSAGGGSGSGMDTPQGVDNDDPSATEGYFIGVDMTSFSILNLRRVSNPGSTPIISPNIVLSVPTTAFPLDQVQSSGLTLDSVSDRLFAAAVHTNRITGTKSLWTAHNIAVDASGVGTVAGDRNGSRWYEIRDLSAPTPSVFQAGTVFNPTTVAPPQGFWMPSVAMSGQGHMALGASFASANDNPGVAVAGRLADDPLGATRLPAALVVLGEARYSDGLNDPPQRWGDYSQTAVDPTDAQTMWTFQEYSNFAGLWTVRAIQLKAPQPQITSASPSTLATGLPSASVVVTGTGFFDPGPDPGGPGFPNHIGASVDGGVILNKTTINSTNSVTLTVSTVCSQAGPHTFRIINPDGQAGTGILTITKFSTDLELTATSDVSFINESVTFTAAVTSSAPGSPPGTVTFKDGINLLAARTLVNGQASFTTSSLALGSHTISAEYAETCDFNRSSSNLLHRVSLFGSAASLASSLNPSLNGNTITFTAGVASVPARGGTPTGGVTFKDGSTSLGTFALNASGQASITTSGLTVGSHFITASYGGDATHGGSTSPTLHQLVQVPGVGLAIQANSPDPVNIGQVVTITTVVTNTGTGTATYNLAQSFLGNFIFLAASSNTGGTCTNSGPITCPLGALDPGGSSTVTTVVRALFGQTLLVNSSVTDQTNNRTGKITNPVRVRFRPFHF